MSFTLLRIVYARDAIAQHTIERDFCNMKNYLPNESGYERSEVLSQDDGLMVAFLTVWTTRDDAQRFDAGGLNRLITAVTELLIAGSPVIRLFEIIC